MTKSPSAPIWLSKSTIIKQLLLPWMRGHPDTRRYRLHACHRVMSLVNWRHASSPGPWRTLPISERSKHSALPSHQRIPIQFPCDSSTLDSDYALPEPRASTRLSGFATSTRVGSSMFSTPGCTHSRLSHPGRNVDTVGKRENYPTWLIILTSQRK